MGRASELPGEGRCQDQALEDGLEEWQAKQGTPGLLSHRTGTGSERIYQDVKSSNIRYPVAILFPQSSSSSSLIYSLTEYSTY